MKKFFLSVLSSFTGTWLALCLFGVVAFIVAISMLINVGVNSISGESKVSFSDNGLLLLDLSGQVEEIESGDAPDMVSLINGDVAQVKSLRAIVDGIKTGAENESVKAMYIECGSIAASPATINAIRDAVNKFKESGKKVYAYGDMMSQTDYYIASLADSIFVNPHSSFILTGVSGSTPYFKSLLDKVGVTMQVVKVGTYKSAVEPYILDNMSEPAKAQLDTLYNALWTEMKSAIATSRNINADSIDLFINRDYIQCQPIDYVVKKGLVDGLCYRHEMESRLSRLMNVDSYKDVELVTPEELDAINLTTTGSTPHIAVLYAVGGIDDGSDSGIRSPEVVNQIFKLKDDENVKGLVLRVNSPGGSAYGSEQIWEALEQFKSAGKPFVVSMGDYAASGGYYISCGADKIFADPMTITGSIGIFALIPQAERLLKDKLGVNFETVSTNPAGNFPSLTKPLTEEQYAAMQRMVENGYDLFTSRVAQGRNMPQSKVKEIGEGRVWDAMTAKRIGLVDELGSLDDAILYVKKLPNMGEDLSIVVYPEIKESFWKYFAMLDESQLTRVIGQVGLNIDDLYMMYIKTILERQPIQARMQDIYVKI